MPPAEFLRWFPRDHNFRSGSVTAAVQASPSNAAKISRGQCVDYLTAFRRFCDYLVRAGVLKENPGRYVGGNSRPSTHSREYLSPEDVQAIVAAVPQDDLRGTRDYAMILLLLRCALAEIELSGLMSAICSMRMRNWMTEQGQRRKTKTTCGTSSLFTADSPYPLSAARTARPKPSLPVQGTGRAASV